MVQVFRYAGFGKETTFGTPVTPSIYIAPTRISMDSPPGVSMVVPDGLGRDQRRSRPGYYSPKGGLEYNPDLISLGWLLNWTMSGGYSYTAGSGGSPVLNTHEIYGDNSNEPDFFTLYTGKDVFDHVFTSTVINSLNLSVSAGGLATCSLDMLAQKDDAANIKSEADLTTLVTGTNLAFQDATCTVNGVDETAWVNSFTLNLSNNISADSGKNIGSRYPRRFRSGKRGITFSIQLLFEDMDMFDLYWGDISGTDVDGADVFALKPKFTLGDQYIEYHMPKVEIDTINTQPGGSDTLIQTISGSAYLAQDVAMADSSTIDTSILVTLKNSAATMA